MKQLWKKTTYGINNLIFIYEKRKIILFQIHRNCEVVMVRTIPFGHQLDKSTICVIASLGFFLFFHIYIQCGAVSFWLFLSLLFFSLRLTILFFNISYTDISFVSLSNKDLHITPNPSVIFTHAQDVTEIMSIVVFQIYIDSVIQLSKLLILFSSLADQCLVYTYMQDQSQKSEFDVD